MEEERNGFKIYRFTEGSNAKNTFVHKAEQAGLLKKVDAICIFGVGHDKRVWHWIPLLTRNTPVYLKVGTSGDLVIREIDKKLLYRLDGIFCQNNEIASEAVDLGFPKKKCIPIKNGLDINAWRRKLPNKKDAKKLLNIPENIIVCSSIGRFVIRKNFPLVISSFLSAMLKNNHSLKAVLLIHGSDFGQHDGEEDKILEMIKKTNTILMKKGCCVILITPEIDTSYTLAASDFFITLGEREGAPNIIIEALASACPVIASNISGHRVYIKHFEQGLLVDLEEKKIADAISKLISSKTIRLKMSKKAFASANRFNIRKTSLGYIKAIKK